jgi:uncharacterized protein involved in exopolysaccharide biosynthesis
MEKTENYKRELLAIFFAQRRLILGVTLIIIIGAILIGFCWPPTYSATASLLVRSRKPERNQEALEKADKIWQFEIKKEDLSSEVEILISPSVIERTIRALQEKKLYPESETISSKDINRIKRKLEAEVVPASNVIDITFYNKDPKVAETFLSALVDQYTFYRIELFNGVNQIGSFFSFQADRFNESLSKKGEELMALAEETKIANPQREIENNLDIKKDLELRLDILKNEVIEKTLFIKYVEKILNLDNIHFFSSIENDTINGVTGLSPKLQELLIKQAEILSIYKPSSSKAVAVQTEINKIHSAIKNEVFILKENLSNQLKIAEAKIKRMQDRVEIIDDRNVEIRKQDIAAQRLEAESALLLASYETFSKRKEESIINSSLEGTAMHSNVSILQKAFPSDGPVFPRKGVIIPLGALFGLILGISLGFLREYFDHTFKRPSDVENYLKLPVIFSINK